MVYADPGLLRSVLSNLLGNAWKYTGKRSHAHVDVRRVPGGFCVRDDGAGLDMAVATRLFEPFHRLHAEGDFPGTGIGLATVKRIVERLGGKAWTEAAVDRSATMFCPIPPAPRPSSPAADEATADRGPAPS